MRIALACSQHCGLGQHFLSFNGLQFLSVFQMIKKFIGLGSELVALHWLLHWAHMHAWKWQCVVHQKTALIAVTAKWQTFFLCWHFFWWLIDHDSVLPNPRLDSICYVFWAILWPTNHNKLSSQALADESYEQTALT